MHSSTTELLASKTTLLSTFLFVNNNPANFYIFLSVFVSNLHFSMFQGQDKSKSVRKQKRRRKSLVWAESRIQDSMISKPITIVFMITVEQLIAEINKLVSTVNLMWFILYMSLIKVQQSNFRQHPLLARVRLALGARFEQRCKERRKNDRTPNKRESKD